MKSAKCPKCDYRVYAEWYKSPDGTEFALCTNHGAQIVECEIIVTNNEVQHEQRQRQAPTASQRSSGNEHHYSCLSLDGTDPADDPWSGAVIDWVIVGGESGPGARAMDTDWVRSLRDQCKVAGVPFLFKQWGEYAPNWLNDNAGNKIPGSEWMDKLGKKIAGRVLDGETYTEYPKIS